MGFEPKTLCDLVGCSTTELLETLWQGSNCGNWINQYLSRHQSTSNFKNIYCLLYTTAFQRIYLDESKIRSAGKNCPLTTFTISPTWIWKKRYKLHKQHSGRNMLLVVDDTVNKTFNLKTLNIKKWRLQTSYSLAVLILPQSIAMTAWYCLLRLAKKSIHCGHYHW